MHIPEKYAELYNRLAHAHPWMREMRDEYGMSDDELIRKLRHYAGDIRYGYNPLDDIFEPDDRLCELCGQVANMLEYYEGVDEAKEMWAKACERERAKNAELTAERDNTVLTMVDECDRWKARATELEAERDEWKAKCEQAERAMNAAAGKWAKADEESRELRKMLALDDGTIEEYTERADPLTALAYQKQLAEEWRDRCHNAEAWCDKLESERDEWKAKAEGSSKVRVGQSKSAKRAAAVERLRGLGEHVMASSIQWALFGPERDNMPPNELRDSLIDLLTDDDGVARSDGGVTNIEWYAKNDLRKLCDLGIDGNMSCDDCPNQCVETEEGTPPEECQRRLIEWLMAPHDCGQNADMSEKSADCVRDGDEMSEVGANDGNATCNNSGENVTDSHEKLEADVMTYLDLPANCRNWCDFKAVTEWFDRQAAITERELCKQCEWPSLAAQPDREMQDRITDLQNQVDDYRAEWHRVCSERDRLRRDLTAEKNKNVELTERWAELNKRLRDIGRIVAYDRNTA